MKINGHWDKPQPVKCETCQVVTRIPYVRVGDKYFCCREHYELWKKQVQH